MNLFVPGYENEDIVLLVGEGSSTINTPTDVFGKNLQWGPEHFEIGRRLLAQVFTINSSISMVHSNCAM